MPNGEQPSSPPRRQAIKISQRARWPAGLLGLAALMAGAVATFTRDVEAGPVALIAAGTLFIFVALAGVLPTRLKIGENEAEWQQEIGEAIEAVATAAVKQEADGTTLDDALSTLAQVSPSTTHSAVQNLAVLSRRFTEAVDQLGDGTAPVRLAGVYALASLADDWPERRQACIDLLCAYLRMPYGADGPESVDSEMPVRKAILDQIVYRVRRGLTADVNWSTCRFDLTGASLNNVRFEDAHFAEPVLLRKAAFDGDCAFVSCTFDAGADFSSVVINRQLVFEHVNVGSGAIRLDDSRIDGRLEIYLDNDALYGQITLNRIRLSGKLSVHLVPPASPIALTINEVRIDGTAQFDLLHTDELRSPHSTAPLINLRGSRVDGRIRLDQRLGDALNVTDSVIHGEVELF